MSFTAFSLYSSAECRMIASLPSKSIFDLESLRSKRVVTSFSACWMAFDTSCRSTLLTTSNVFSGMAVRYLFRFGFPLESRTLKLNGRALFVKRKEAVEVLRGLRTHLIGRESAQ